MKASCSPPCPQCLQRFHLSLTSSNWEMCAQMFGTFETTPDPAKFKMRYWGIASYLQTGCECLDSSNSSAAWFNTGHTNVRSVGREPLLALTFGWLLIQFLHPVRLLVWVTLTQTACSGLYDPRRTTVVDAVKNTSLCLIFTFSSLRLTDDDHWVIDTDYDNYAIHYSCRQVDDDGTCLDSYSFIFSRHLTGLRPEDQSIVQNKKTELCLQNKYRRTGHTGELKAKSIWLCKGFFFAAFPKAVSLIGWDKGESQWFTLAQTPILFPHKFLVFSHLILLFSPLFQLQASAAAHDLFTLGKEEVPPSGSAHPSSAHEPFPTKLLSAPSL